VVFSDCGEVFGGCGVISEDRPKPVPTPFTTPSIILQ
jgi:hypothetical protein